MTKHDPSRLLELAERVEAARLPDREIDDAIHIARTGEKPFNCATSKRYTDSLDAAMRLVPEGWNWACGPRAEWQAHGRSWAWCDETGEDWEDSWNSYAATPALALTAAALRAIAAKEG